MKVPIAPSDVEWRYQNLTHYPSKEWCEHCVRGLGREDRHHTQREADQQGTPVVQLDYSFLTDGCRRVCCEEHTDLHPVTGVAKWGDPERSASTQL
eukprot:3787127-Amphidinium_carterae.1